MPSFFPGGVNHEVPEYFSSEQFEQEFSVALSLPGISSQSVACAFSALLWGELTFGSRTGVLEPHLFIIYQHCHSPYCL